MASLRCDTRIARSPDVLWALLSDPARIIEWFPGMESVTVDGTTRTLTLRSGLPLVEEIVNIDHQLRRFQYRIVGPLPVTFHLGTIDLLDESDADGPATRLVYSTEITPDPMSFVIDGAIAAAIDELRRRVDANPDPTTAIAATTTGSL